MDISIFYAKFLGLLFLVLGISLWVNPKRYKHLLKSYIKQQEIFFYHGLITLIIGMVVTITHNYWYWNWIGIITLFGWISLVKGVSILFFPDMITSWVKKFDYKELQIAGVLFTIVVGIYFSYIGFIA